MRIYTRQTARKLGGFSRSTEHRLSRADPTFPRPVQVTAGRTGYFAEEFDGWLRARPRVVRSFDPVEPAPKPRRRRKQQEVGGSP